MGAFEDVYGLRDEEVIRWIRPPFMALREEFYRKELASRGVLRPDAPAAMILKWEEERPRWYGSILGPADGRHAYTPQTLIKHLLRVFPQDLEGDDRLSMQGMPGDFAFRGGADAEQLRGGLEAIISEKTGAPVRLTFRQVERRAIVFQGKWLGRKPDQPASDQSPRFDVYGGERDLSRGGAGAGSGNVAVFSNRIGSMIGASVVVEAVDVPEKISWHYVRGDGEKERPLTDFAKFLCDQIAEQTSMSWSEETRSLRRMLIERAENSADHVHP
jgi:hypothetical protein